MQPRIMPTCSAERSPRSSAAFDVSFTANASLLTEPQALPRLSTLVSLRNEGSPEGCVIISGIALAFALDFQLSTVNFFLTPLQSALPKNAPITRLESALPNSLDLKSFRIRTCKNRRGGGCKLLTNVRRHPAECPRFGFLNLGLGFDVSFLEGLRCPRDYSESTAEGICTL
jgi:hypothetical protein